MTRPDPKLTPGQAGPVRVARNVPSSVKRTVFNSYGIGLLRRLFFTVDHLIPLELNGTNGLANLWPQPRGEAKVKDRDENRLALAVASGRMTVGTAQRTILDLWGGKSA